MTPREELEALRRLAELEAKAAGSEAKPAAEAKTAPTGPRLRSGRPASSPLRDIRNLAGPLIEGLPAALGGIAGTAVGGPLGMVAGAGLGYGAGKQVTRLMDVALGDQPAPTAGQLADATLPRDIRKQAALTIIRLMENRKGQFVTKDMADSGVPPAAPKGASGEWTVMR